MSTELQKIDRIRFTIRDLELFPNTENCHEIIDGELFVTRAPHWNHQKVLGRLYTALDTWSLSDRGFGEAVPAPGLILSEFDAVIPDVVWVSSQEKLENSLNESGHLTEAPDLVIESLSPGVQNERRDREVKLKLYSIHGVREYWIVDWQARKLEVYRRKNAQLQLVETLFADDTLTSPLLPGFERAIASIFR
ncbi:Protein of unknown function DUF820 [Geitlerinema sp. FC II]|nr:Protein of unknown function DUF820 [Geitlerinema sp. FC II]